MEQNVRYYWIQEQVNHSCPSHITYGGSLYICYQNLLLELRIEVGNGHSISVLFIIPIVIDIHGHIFKIFTLVSEIYENIVLVFGIKNIFELEDITNS